MRPGSSRVVLLRQTYHRFFRFDRDWAQHGHRSRWAARYHAISRRSVASETGMWRWVRIGSTPRPVIFGKGRYFRRSCRNALVRGEKWPFPAPRKHTRQCIRWRDGETLSTRGPRNGQGQSPALIRDSLVQSAIEVLLCQQDARMSRFDPMSRARILSVPLHQAATQSRAIPREPFSSQHRDRARNGP
jgi:hypothetical protein